MSYRSVILTVTTEMMSSALKAAVIHFWPLEGRGTPKQADRHTALKYYRLIKLANGEEEGWGRARRCAAGKCRLASRQAGALTHRSNKTN